MLNSLPILHVEDNQDDQFFLQRAFAETRIPNAIHVVEDGQAAMNYLSAQGPYADRQRFPLPCLIILDLKLPKVHGLEVLKWIRSQQELKSIIVIILSSSPLRNDVDIAYDTGANSFVVKPLTGGQMTNIARLIKEYWLETNEFPSAAGVEDPFGKLGTKPPRPLNV